jgi:hypothetical protein
MSLILYRYVCQPRIADGYTVTGNWAALTARDSLTHTNGFV